MSTPTIPPGRAARDRRSDAAVTQVCLPGQTHVAPGPHDHTGMYVMHHAFRRDLARFAAAIALTPLGEVDTWSALAKRWARFTRVLHEHHHAEDEHYWPVLEAAIAARGTGSDRAEVEAMSTEHAAIDPALATLTAGLQAIVQHPCDDHRHALEIRMAGLREVLGAHLAHEETTVLPIVQRVMSDAEFARVERAIEKSYPSRDAAFLIAWVADGLPDQVRERILTRGGLPFRILYAVVRGPYARREQRAFRYGGLLGAA